MKGTLPTKIWITIGFILLIAVSGYSNCEIDHYFSQCDCSKRICFFNAIVRYLFFIVIFSTYYLYEQYQLKKTEIEASKKEQFMAELQSLKAQINPHFLLNTLNSMYSHVLIHEKDSKFSEILFKFSEILKYVVYEGEADEIRLKRELNHIRDYVDLQMFRLEDKLKVDLVFDIENDHLLIAPHILMTFIENAFKYSSELPGADHPIHIRISEKENTVIFYCSNPYQNNSQENRGIGIKNTTRRLKLIYPERHDLQLNQENGVFTVSLKIQLT